MWITAAMAVFTTPRSYFKAYPGCCNFIICLCCDICSIVSRKVTCICILPMDRMAFSAISAPWLATIEIKDSTILSTVIRVFCELDLTVLICIIHTIIYPVGHICLLYTSDAADDLLCVDLGGR